jgi:hypothetical protein
LRSNDIAASSRPLGKNSLVIHKNLR